MRPSSDTLLVWAAARCTYGCEACPIDSAAAPQGADAAALHKELVAVRDREGRLVLLVGGEPFLRPDILRLVATIRADGCAPGIVTTGSALAYPQVRQKLLRAGLSYMRVQLFGCGEPHDRAAAVSSAYDAVIAGVRAWINEAGAQCDTDLALTLRGRGVGDLVSEVRKLAEDVGSPDIQLIIAADRLGEAEFADAAAALSNWNDDPELPMLIWEGLAEPVAPAEMLAVPPLRPYFVGEAPRATCLGVVEEVTARLDAVTPRVRSNSFNFIRSTVAVPFAERAVDCTAHQQGTEDPARSLWLGEDGRELVQYQTDTADFDSSEVARVKDDWSHLFVDRAEVGVLDDFREGMRRVLPDPVCTTCDHRDRCARRYRVIDGQPFATEESWIADYVTRLRGRVLDVGCGEQLYRDEIVPLVRSGVLSYTGLDPDEPSLNEWREVLPEGRFIQGGIEDLQAEPASYDRVLCLRSLNHVFDLDEAIARMAALLKPGGQLLIVETTPFAMLRHQEQVAAADRAPRAGHQHYRNVTSEDVLAVCPASLPAGASTIIRPVSILRMSGFSCSNVLTEPGGSVLCTTRRPLLLRVSIIWLLVFAELP